MTNNITPEYKSKLVQLSKNLGNLVASTNDSIRSLEIAFNDLSKNTDILVFKLKTMREELPQLSIKPKVDKPYWRRERW